jgi:hypothetical protein
LLAGVVFWSLPSYFVLGSDRLGLGLIGAFFIVTGIILGLLALVAGGGGRRSGVYLVGATLAATALYLFAFAPWGFLPQRLVN